MQAVRLVSRSALFGSPRVSVCARSFTTATQAAAPAKIPITLIQDLRSRTGAGVTDCKKALELNQGDIASAATWLREKGKSTATKLSGRVAGEGVIALATQGNNGVIIELNSETDFVARGASFRSLAHKIVDQSVVLKHIIPSNVIDPIEMDTLKKLQVEVEHDEPGHAPVKIPVEEAITRAITKTKENIQVRRAFGITIDKGVVGGYIHGGEGDTKAGRLGALVTLVSDAGDHAALTELASKLAMHVVGLNPKCIDSDSSVVAEEYARRTAKNPKYSRAAVAEDLALLAQKYFSGEGETVKEALEHAGKKLGAPVRIHSFLRLAVGEGVEKKADNFAEEVMGMVKQ